MTARSRKEEKRYRHYRTRILPAGRCDFCDIAKKDAQFMHETLHFKVIKNIFPYTTWDHKGVEDHLLIVPKQHTDTLTDLYPDEALEYIKLISAYESKGYNVYARAPEDKTKSVAHQHTHLIKPNKKALKFLLYAKTPYLRIARWNKV